MKTLGKKACLLDRDGTIIIDRVYLNDPDGISYLPGAIEGLRAMRDLGYLLFVVTNQSGIARGVVTMGNLDRIHAKMRADLAGHGIEIAGFYYAPYSAESTHFARKPNPGMLVYAAQDFGIDLSQSWMIGDRMIDVEAGHRAGCRSIMLHGTETPEIRPDLAGPEAFVTNLVDAASFIRSASHL